MPYLTPQELPEGDDCRPLFIPANTEWLALFGGALTELIKSYNWEDSGGLTIAETVEKMTEIINAWYSDPCVNCELPGGGRLIRINIDGHVQELVGDEWVEPTGDYELPPIEEREGGTIDDQICLAAKNAANVLQLLYENLSDSFNGDLDEAEAVTALIGAVIGFIGAAAGAITYSIARVALWIFSILYSVLEFAIADLWTPEFTDQLVCILKDCASNDGGVVTFDWDCFNAGLNEQLNSFSLTSEQLRLYVQIQLMLSIIGGVDALNLAGATTAITDDECPCGWCYTWDQDAFEADWTEDFSGFNGNWFVDYHLEFAETLRINSCVMEVEVVSLGTSQRAGWWTFNYSGMINDEPLSFGTNLVEMTGMPRDLDGAAVSAAPSSGTSGSIYIRRVTMTGDGNNPFGTDNCD